MQRHVLQKGLDLRREHAAIHQQPVRKHDDRAFSARVFVIQLLAIDVRERHAELLKNRPPSLNKPAALQPAQPAKGCARVTQASARRCRHARTTPQSAVAKMNEIGRKPLIWKAPSAINKEQHQASARWMMIFCTSLVPS